MAFGSDGGRVALGLGGAFRPWSGWAAVILLAAALAVAALYGRGLDYPLVFDDGPFFREENLTAYARSVFIFHLRWFPYASFGWTYNLVGFDWEWYRAGNLAAHLGVMLAAYSLAWRLNAALGGSQLSLIALTRLQVAAALGAALFALHPVAVYAVAYLVQRSILFSTLFGLLMLVTLVQGLERRSRAWLAASATLYMLSVFSKEHAVMLPVVAGLIAWALRDRAMALARPLALTFAAYGATALLVVLRSTGILGNPYEIHAMMLLEALSVSSPGLDIENAYPLSVITQTWLFFRYLLVWLVPNPGWMAIDLRAPFAGSLASVPHLAALGGFIAFALVGFALLRRGGNRAAAGLAVLGIWILFLPELSTVRIQEPFVLYRSYLWMSVLPLALAALAGGRKPGVPWLLAAAVLAGGALAAATENRFRTFADETVLWEDAIAKADPGLLGAARQYLNRGTAFLRRGRGEEALRDFDRALELEPRLVYARMNRGGLLHAMGQSAEGLAEIEAAIRQSPGFEEPYISRAVILFSLGRQTDAMSDLNLVLARNPSSVRALANRCGMHLLQSRLDAAVVDCSRALELAPRNYRARVNRGEALLSAGRFLEAAADFEAAARTAPARVRPLLGLAQARLGVGERAAAREALARACDLGERKACRAAAGLR